MADLEDAVDVLRAARSVIVVPGYGMAVSQAQHAIRELAAVLKAEKELEQKQQETHNLNLPLL